MHEVYFLGKYQILGEPIIDTETDNNTYVSIIGGLCYWLFYSVLHYTHSTQ